MSLSDIEFAYFLPLVLLVYWAGPRKAAYQNAVIVLASLLFYVTWNLELAGLLIVSLLVDFAVLRGFDKTRLEGSTAPEAELAATRKRRRRWLALGVGQNLAVLVTFKYAGFFATTLNDLTSLVGSPGLVPVLRIALPLGVSFYTMSRIGALIDTYYERVEPVRSLLVWASFVLFFPQLIAGPIGRIGELGPQYEKARRLDPAQIYKAAGEIITGLVLKVYVAAVIGADWVDPVFAAPGTFDRASHAMALAGYAMQVFSDFAGYSLLAIGVGRLLGVTLPDNFNFPFLSVTPMDVWRRWHMSLNRWLFDYLFGPWTTGDSFLRGRLMLGFIVVFLISGLWHGPTYNFVLWGLLHGLWLAAHYRYDLFYKGLCRKDRVWVQRRKTTAYKLAGWALTIGFFVLTLIPFRAPTLEGAAAFAGGLFVGGTAELESSTMHPMLCTLFVVGYHLKELPLLAPIQRLADRAPAALRGLAFGLTVIFLFMFAPIGAGTFIYAQF